MQAGLVSSHPVQKERELVQMVGRNPYEHALLCIHQAPYQHDHRKQAELLQVWYQVKLCYASYERSTRVKQALPSFSNITTFATGPAQLHSHTTEACVSVLR